MYTGLLCSSSSHKWWTRKGFYNMVTNCGHCTSPDNSRWFPLFYVLEQTHVCLWLPFSTYIWCYLFFLTPMLTIPVTAFVYIMYDLFCSSLLFPCLAYNHRTIIAKKNMYRLNMSCRLNIDYLIVSFFQALSAQQQTRVCTQYSATEVSMAIHIK